MKRLLLSACIFFNLLCYVTAHAQEVCNDGIDNDGDGFIDCFDPDCASSSDCDGFYLGNDASCEATPSAFPVFSLKLHFGSPNKSANHLGRIAVGDLDRDGIPEIATQNRYTDELYLLNGNDGTVKFKTTYDNPRWRMSIANVQDDNCGEVYAVRNKSGNYYITAFDCSLNQMWESEARNNDPIHLGYADFDRDGQPEMYYKDEIRDPITGTRIIKGNDGNWGNISGGPVAVDILGDENLELVSGGTIYSVNLGARTADAGSLTAIATIPGFYAVKRSESATSVADFNLDGFLDVIISGKNASGVTTVFFWDVQNNTVKTFNDAFGGGDYKNGWKGGTGRLNIGDLDGDGQLNVSYVSGRYLYALDENWNLFWRVVINEETSGYTGCTLFDFNGDGKTEVVYRDEQWLYIINGTDGTVYTQVACISRTNVEYPIVADVDADGATELCVVCGTDDAAAWANFGNLAYSENSQVRVFKSNGEPWVPARRLWNQHGYFNVNVNDDLSIPATQQKHHLVWSAGTCTAGPNRPLNGFLNQSPFLNSDGCPTYAAPDLAVVDNSLVIQQPDCPDNDFMISFDFENIGDVNLSGDVPVTFYNGDPTQPGAVKLGTETFTINNLGIGDIFNATNVPVTGPGSAFTLYVVLNDDGSTVPTPISLPNTDFLECDYGNNIVSGTVTPNPFALSTETTDNITCVGGSVPANGSARAFRLVGGVEETSDYTFNWFDGPSATGTPDFQGAIYNGLSAGTYSVYATHKTAMCNSDTIQVVINDIPTTVTVDVVVDQEFTNCGTPDGQLSVIVNGGAPVGNYTYEWRVGNQAGSGTIISTSHIASGLSANSYVVEVIDKVTGCRDIGNGTITDNSVTPVVSASAVDIICSTANSGSVSADVSGSTTGFTFEWYIGSNVKPTADFTGATQSNLNKGNYTVVATDNASQCTSAPITVNVGQTSPPSITGTSTTDYTSCDSAIPNGSATVTFSGSASNFTIEWFAGANTNPPVIGTGSTVNNLAAGLYTVRLTNNTNGCIATSQATVNSNVVSPTISVNATPATDCSPFNGSVTASVSIDNVSDYTYTWYDGNNTSAPTRTETGNTISNLTPGFYTVQAFHNSRNCITNIRTIEVLDNTPAINIMQDGAVTSLPTSCDVNDGILGVTINSPGNSSGFDVEWYAGPIVTGSAFLTESGVSNSTASNLFSGLYTVFVTDLDNGCTNTETFDLPFADAHVITLVSTQDATTCIPNNDGEMVISLTPTPTPGFDESDYDINIYTGTDTSVPPIQNTSGVAGTSNYTFTGLFSGTYTVEAIETDPTLSNCSVFMIVEIGLDATDPVIAETQLDNNTNCSDGTANGLIEIEIDGGAAATDYTISWFEGPNTSSDPLGTTIGGTAGVNGEIANSLRAGVYTVSVLNIATQCSSTASYNIIENLPTITIASADLVTQPLTRCDFNDGEAIINGVTENGIPGNLADYTFEWFDAGMNILPNAGAPNTSSSITNLPAGTYFVTATNTNTSCATALTEFVIEDNTINDPDITLIDFLNPTRCRQDDDGDNADNDNLLGFLEISVAGSSTTGYDIEWRENNSTGPIVASGIDVSRIDNLTFLTATQDYYVEVINRDTQCSTSTTFRMTLDVDSVHMSVSATPVTSCASPDGTVFATVTSGGSNNYNYSWSDVNGPLSTGKNILNLPAGDYTVIATDLTDAGCSSAPTTVTITNEQVFPNIAANMIAPVTVCDLSRADGVARANVDGGFIGYTFEWFEGSTATGPVVYTGSEFSGMQPITYTVRATNNVSQCASEAQVTITQAPPVIPDPIVVVIAHDTHCVLENGKLSTSVNGNTSEYIFDWYIGSSVSGTADFTGEIFSDLAAGLYTVTATSKITGCTSAPVTAEVLELLQFPEFEFEVGNASCEQNDGFAKMVMLNTVEIETITWTDQSTNNQVAVGPNLSEVPVGMYSVLAVTALGCETTGEVEIKTEVNPYNGISRNGDAANDFFVIDCIENFPQNIVKIFNRAGTLVFEAEGYDNSNVLFDGVSNKGISILGTNLPDGTYFYIIDKKDGSKPVSGYLEIVN